MAVGFGLLGLEPRAFWSFTLAELNAAVRGRFGAAASERPLSRRDLTTLEQRYPDTKNATQEG
ncbi:phage tail assembly chaperone [Hyphomicrobium sp.]|uniref:phage tail assembly chaperone n=1 Tax=Hyphomicrobium sp. TaxID=82 RepID=UPI003F70D743